MRMRVSAVLSLGVIGCIAALTRTHAAPAARAPPSDGPGSILPIKTNWSWDKLPVFTFGTNRTCDTGEAGPVCDESGVDSAAEVQWKLKYDLVL